jgi:hypothetical protein
MKKSSDWGNRVANIHTEAVATLNEAFLALDHATTELENMTQVVLPKLSPIEVGAQVLACSQTCAHYNLGRRLLRRLLPLIEDARGTRHASTLEHVCRFGGRRSVALRRSCQDYYALLCAFEGLTDNECGRGPAATEVRSDSPAGNLQVSQCVRDFNELHSALMPPAVRWVGPWGITRQLPRLHHSPWWDSVGIEPAARNTTMRSGVSMLPWADTLLAAVLLNLGPIRGEILASLATSPPIIPRDARPAAPAAPGSSAEVRPSGPTAGATRPPSAPFPTAAAAAWPASGAWHGTNLAWDRTAAWDVATLSWAG